MLDHRKDSTEKQRIKKKKEPVSQLSFAVSKGLGVINGQEEKDDSGPQF